MALFGLLTGLPKVRFPKLKIKVAVDLVGLFLPLELLNLFSSFVVRFMISEQQLVDCSQTIAKEIMVVMDDITMLLCNT